MITELKTWKITCDGRDCNESLIAISQYTPKTPANWHLISVGPCGMTNYYRDELRCPACFELDENKNKV